MKVENIAYRTLTAGVAVAIVLLVASTAMGLLGIKAEPVTIVAILVLIATPPLTVSLLAVVLAKRGERTCAVVAVAVLCIELLSLAVCLVFHIIGGS